ncbi:Uncharacterised protein [Chryseobacterium nakagawai]|nr:Uncharacterised protein [Chryseobacterium nakagawai]
MQDTIKNFKSKLFFISLSHSFEFSLNTQSKEIIKQLKINTLNTISYEKLKLVNIIKNLSNYYKKEIIIPNN